MNMTLVQGLCLGILLLGAVLRWRAGAFETWLRDAPIICCGALVCEDSCIRLYGFYDYAPSWSPCVGTVPLLVGIIWIFVVLSARDVALLLAPRHWLPVAFGVIAYDAALIEPIATHSGLWQWHEAGPFAVPWIGELGWALFGVSALACLSWLPGPLRWATVLLAPLATHAMLLVLWWGLLRWTLRGQPADAAMAALGVGVAVVLAVVLWRTRRVGRIPLALIAPRVMPALFFFGLLAAVPASAGLWVYAVSFALPWMVATGWRRAEAVG